MIDFLIYGQGTPDHKGLPLCPTRMWNNRHLMSQKLDNVKPLILGHFLAFDDYNIRKSGNFSIKD